MSDKVKKLVVAVDISKDSFKKIEQIKEKMNLENYDVHLIHVFETVYYHFDLSAIVYPREDEIPEIENKINAELIHLKNKILPHPYKNHFVSKCFFDVDAKEKVVNYLKEVGAETLVVATRGKKGLEGVFDSSFAQYMCKHAPCSVLVLR